MFCKYRNFELERKICFTYPSVSIHMDKNNPASLGLLPLAKARSFEATMQLSGPITCMRLQHSAPEKNGVFGFMVHR